MEYNFDEINDRSKSDALKLEALQPRWGRTDLLAMWIADMDFKTPPFIVNALKKRMECEIFGYTAKPQQWYDAIINWQQKRFGWNISQEMISFTPGVVPALAMVVQAFTEKGDKVLIQQPVYYPFSLVVENNNRILVNSPLELIDGQYQINFDRLEKDIKGCKVFLFCHPHNPGGRVWRRDELERVADICHRNNVVLVSDEIHADLTLPPHKHIPLGSVSDQARQMSITFASPSKAFNMAGFTTSYAVIQNPELREKFQSYVEGNMLGDGNVFAYQTVIAAYTEGEEWLNKLLKYIQKNIDFVVDYVEKNIPKVKCIVPEASYLVFLDFRGLEICQESLVHLCVDGAKLALNDGAMYGKEGEGFMRINLACPQSIIAQALHQLKDAIEKQEECV
ncbi:MalY/PatB family protein [Capnocytophaga canis]|uniref:cysteine-S-conjugate beta-lyase n=1 Tax=Capnocytophaga canis TaxID=1848903 RepID=A0A0B7IRA5_9FLAO|nr:PatB family C-S lyase [Capnocytophaga canis]CEN45910.1 Cystathionine beta-lyase PatB [Capnocytophaga canis]CEN54360.1 Cystathionine beta-lyase PatB [Capnocytophaga canis]